MLSVAMVGSVGGEGFDSSAVLVLLSDSFFVRGTEHFICEDKYSFILTVGFLVLFDRRTWTCL